MSAYYEPEYQIRETEEVLDCAKCEEPTWHLIRWYSSAPPEQECEDCAEVSEYRGNA